MPVKPRHPPTLDELRAAAAAAAEHPRTRMAIGLLERLLPRAASHIREVAEALPDMCVALVEQASTDVAREAERLDRLVSRHMTESFDAVLVDARRRAPKAKRLTAGSGSRARAAARRSKAR